MFGYGYPSGITTALDGRDEDWLPSSFQDFIITQYRSHDSILKGMIKLLGFEQSAVKEGSELANELGNFVLKLSFLMEMCKINETEENEEIIKDISPFLKDNERLYVQWLDVAFGAPPLISLYDPRLVAEKNVLGSGRPIGIGTQVFATSDNTPSSFQNSGDKNGLTSYLQELALIDYRHQNNLLQEGMKTPENFATATHTTPSFPGCISSAPPITISSLGFVASAPPTATSSPRSVTEKNAPGYGRPIGVGTKVFATSHKTPSVFQNSGLGGVNPNFYLPVEYTTKIKKALEGHQRITSMRENYGCLEEKCVNSVDITTFGELSQISFFPAKYTWTVNALPMRTDFYGIESTEICHGMDKWCLCLYPNGLPENRQSDAIILQVNPGDQYVPLRDMVLAVVPKNVLPGFYGHEYDHWKIDVRLPDKTLLKSFRMKRTFRDGNARRSQYFVLPFEVVKQVRHSADHCSLVFGVMSEIATEPVVEASSRAALMSGFDRLAQDLKDMLASRDSGDTTIRVKGQKDFRVHRLILGARTPVFTALFKDKMSGNTTDIINIEDCEPDTFQLFLQYIYTGKVEDLSPKNAHDLYEVAIKYQMDSLKLDCLEYIKDSLSVESICDTLVLAHRHEEKELTELAMEFFTENSSQVFETVEWQNFVIKNSSQASKFLMVACQLLKIKTNDSIKKEP